MAFLWKEHGIWKGEGIYHLTFTVTGRQHLLGRLVAIEDNASPVSSSSQPNDSRSYIQDVQRPVDTNGNAANTCHFPKHTTSKATVRLTALGFALSDHLQHIAEFVDGVQMCAKQIMPDHVHVILWVKQDTGRSIRQIGNGIRIGVKKAAIALGVWNVEQGHVLDIPFIRTLSHKGQLRRMIDYVHANPDSAWERQQNPDFYTIRRGVTMSDLHFDAMGKMRLLDYHNNTALIAATEQNLQFKAQQKGLHYTPLPHTSKRWLMIAGNMMLQRIAASPVKV